MIIVFIGDVVGRSGRRAVEQLLPPLIEERRPDLVIANIENSAGGFGITEKAMREVGDAGVRFFTSGNHVWDKREGVEMLDVCDNLLRPANYPMSSPGHGSRIIDVEGVPVAIFNIQGRVFMPPLECPFRTIDRLLEQVDDDCVIKVVDMHAEATSEKIAMGWYLDGRVSAVLGTHTHLRTGDSRLLPEGTAYVTDVGMTGSNDSVLGMDKAIALQRFLEMRPVRFEVARADLRSDMVVLDIDNTTGKTKRIEHIQLKVEP